MCRPNDVTQGLLVFHDPTGLSDKELVDANNKALKQTGRILAIFRGCPDGWFTPYDIQSLYEIRYKEPILITSARRSMTELTSGELAGRLIKGSRADQIPEKHGRNNNCWRYNKDYQPPLNPEKHQEYVKKRKMHKQPDSFIRS